MPSASSSPSRTKATTPSSSVLGQAFKLALERSARTSAAPNCWTARLWGDAEQFVSLHLRKPYSSAGEYLSNDVHEELSLNVIVKRTNEDGSAPEHVHASRVLDPAKLRALFQEWEIEAESQEALASYFAHLLQSLFQDHSNHSKSVQFKRDEEKVTLPVSHGSRVYALGLSCSPLSPLAKETVEYFRGLAEEEWSQSSSQHTSPSIVLSQPGLTQQSAFLNQSSLGSATQLFSTQSFGGESNGSPAELAHEASQSTGISLTRVVSKPVKKDLISGRSLPPPKRRKV